jgi:N-acetyl-beta-hexosaminidase
VTAGSLRGLHHALVTLAQVLRLSTNEEGLAPVLIQDYPKLKHRGALLDISPHSRIPALVIKTINLTINVNVLNLKFN